MAKTLCAFLKLLNILSTNSDSELENKTAGSAAILSWIRYDVFGSYVHGKAILKLKLMFESGNKDL